MCDESAVESGNIAKKREKCELELEKNNRGLSDETAVETGALFCQVER